MSVKQQNFFMFVIVLGQHVSILIESYSGPSKKTDRYLEIFKMRCGVPNASIIDKTTYKMRTQRHMHFIHSHINNVSDWDPTAHFKHC